MIFRASAGLFFMGLLLSVAMLQMAEALIYPGTVQLIPSGNLQMSANWIDTPKNGTWYNVLLLTNFVGMTASTHIKRDFTYEGTTAKIEIGDFNSHEWVPANNATMPRGNFPGFRQEPAGVQYRLYIQYYNAMNETLINKGCPTTIPCNPEVSVFAHPMVPAYPPSGVAACGMQDYQNGGVRACSFIAPLPYSLRVYWNQIPASERGFKNPPPTALYPIAYYRVEVSESQSFQSLVRNTTCTKGQTDNICNFDERIAILTGLTKTQVYYFRVLGGTIIGDGNASSVSNAYASIPLIGSCDAGFEDTNLGSETVCTACGPGTYKAFAGAGACSSCPEHFAEGNRIVKYCVVVLNYLFGVSKNSQFRENDPVRKKILLREMSRVFPLTLLFKRCVWWY
jgi:hypothetical protein